MIKFSFSVTEQKLFDEWRKQHNRKCEMKNKMKNTSGLFTYHFTPIGPNCIKEVSCVCGKKIDVTDERW